MTPIEITSRKQWCVWNDENGNKMPLQINGQPLRSNDPSTFTTHDAAHAASSRIAYVIQADDEFTGIDLDNCIDENGELRDWAVPIATRLDGVSFAEISPSGHGIKFLTRAKKTAGAKCLHKFGPDKQQLESYDFNRFWTITGNTYAGNTIIGDGQAVIDWICETYLKNEHSAPATTTSVSPGPTSSLEKRAEHYVQNADRPVAGDRNNSVFRLAGHLFALAERDGSSLPPSRVLDFVLSFNASFIDPLTASEVERTVNSARSNGTAREPKLPKESAPVFPDIDLSNFSIGLPDLPDDDDLDDELMFAEMIPQDGLIRDIFDFYWRSSFKRTNVIGLAVAVSICQTIFGRRIQSHTGMRTNDYNVVIASTSTGKDACKKTCVAVLRAGANAARLADPTAFLTPSRIKSSTGLISQIAKRRTAIWVCDEFGKVLKAILDPKSRNGPLVEVADDLLEFYGDSNGTFLGSAYAAGKQHEVEQPHLCLLGITTGNIFNAVTSEHVHDGLLGRLAFWQVRERPKRSKEFEMIDVPDDLAAKVGAWMAFEPGFTASYPDPVTLQMSPDALARWESHADAIEDSMDSEGEMRAAIWARVATRSMKLALTHRAARCTMDPATLPEHPVEVELQDVDWAIRLSNRLARIACQLIGENIVDEHATRARGFLLEAVRSCPDGLEHSFYRKQRKYNSGEIRAAATELEANGMIRITKENTKGRPKTTYFPQ